MIPATFWAGVLPSEPNAEWRADARRIAIEADARRRWADYNTGSITELEAYVLRALAESIEARVVIEVGTFIGTSTCALASASTVEALYTCDVSNDCFRASGVITTFPKVSSTKMLRHLVGRGVRADLCFFDGVLSSEDADLLTESTTESPVFAVHDYNYGPKRRIRHGTVSYETVPRKGVGNIGLLQQRWPSHAIVEPLPETTLALLVPESAR